MRAAADCGTSAAARLYLKGPRSSHHRSLVLEPPEVVLRYPFGGLPTEAHTMHTGGPIVHAAVDAGIDDLFDHRIGLEVFMRHRTCHGARENHMCSRSEYPLNGFGHRAGGTSVGCGVLRVRRRRGQGCPT